MPRRISTFAVLAAVALAAVACGGASDSKSSGSGSGAARGNTKLSLVAYSTPQVAYDEVIPAFNRPPPARASRSRQSYGASGDQSRAVENGLQADVVAFSLEPDIDRARQGRPGRQGLDADADQGHRHGLGRRLRRAQGQPEGHQDLGRPAQARRRGDHAEPVHLGRREVEPAGGLRRADQAGQDAGAGARLPEQADHQARQGPGQERPRGGADFIGGNGDVLLSYENEAITAQQKGEDIDYVIPDQTILIQNPAAVTTKANRHRRRRSWTTCRPTPAQTTFAQHGYRPVDAAVAEKSTVPDAAGLFTIDDLGGWSKVNDEFFDPDKGSVTKIEQTRGSPLTSEVARPLRRARRRPRGRRRAVRRRAPRARWASASPTLWLSLIVLIPLAAVVVDRDGTRTSGTAISSPPAVAALELTVGVSLVVAAINAVAGTLIAWVLVRDGFPGQRWSTRSSTCRSRCRRSWPASSCSRSTATTARWASTSPTRAAAIVAGAAVRHAAVRRALGAAGADRARHRDGGGRDLARRERRARPSGGSCCRTCVPAIFSGAALAFARAVGEFGSIVLISGNIPLKTEVASVFVYGQIESDAVASAAAVSVVLLAISLVVLLVIRAGARGGSQHERLGAALPRARLPGRAPARSRSGWSSTARSSTGSARLGLDHDAGGDQRVLADDRGDRDRRAAQHRVRRSSPRWCSRAAASAASRCWTR